jgi:hypothetical protein
VILADTATYLHMSYISYYLDGWLSDNLYMYNWMGHHKRTAFWNNFAANTRFKSRHVVDLDFSEWDGSMSMDLLLLAIEELERLCAGRGRVSDLLNPSFAQLRHLVTHTTIGRDEAGLTSSRLVTSGILSGWRWTTLLNSLINAALQLIILGRADIVTLGDDVHAEVDARPDMARIVADAAELGFKVNAAKSHVSMRTDDVMSAEFLKMSSSDGSMPRGDPVRVVRSILWSREAEQEGAPEWLFTPPRHGDRALAMTDKAVKPRPPQLYILWPLARELPAGGPRKAASQGTTFPPDGFDAARQ